MPIVRIEMFSGRSHDLKMKIAEAITDVLQREAGIAPSATTVMFSEVQPSDWVVGGKPYAQPDPSL